jgi:hypothetical protein
MVGCTVAELGERMTAEEFAWWTVVMEEDAIGPHQQARLHAHVAAQVRNPTLKGPRGDGTLWSADDFIDPERWARKPSKVQAKRALKKAIHDFFGKFGFNVGADKP